MSSHSDQVTPTRLAQAIQLESEKFQEYYQWLEKAMPEAFFEEMSLENLTLITHSLIGFPLQEYFSVINLKSAAIVIVLDSSDADLRILQNYALYGIKNYQAYVSTSPAPFPGITAPLRIATLDFTELLDATDKTFPPDLKNTLRKLVKKENPEISEQEFDRLIAKTSTRFLLSLTPEHLALAIHMLYRAETRDSCQYEVRYEDEWYEKKNIASMNIVLAWRNTPKHNFLYRIAKVVYRHGLSMKLVNATYTQPSFSSESILVMALSLHGSNGQAVWDVADIPDFLRELTTVKYFDTNDKINDVLVAKGIISGNMGNLLRSMINFIHQSLVYLDVNLYTVENIEEALCRHPELTVKLCQTFKYKFDPNLYDLKRYEELKGQFLQEVLQLDTGQGENDTRRKNVLNQAINFVIYTLKTNFYRLNYTSLCFRLDPFYMDDLPFDRTRKFPELPYGIFYIRGMHFFGYHIRFKDLSRGGLRTVYPDQVEQMIAERNNVFTECYNLAWTQHKKNKELPEGGSKGIIFLKPFSQIDSDSQIFAKEMERAKRDPKEIEVKINAFRTEQKLEYLHQAQRAYIESLVTLVNCTPDGKIRARYIKDYWNKPEYLYLGPDENMHDSMIEWIAKYSIKYNYRPGGAFISGKPGLGINHKEYGVTSLGVNVYMDKLLRYLGINPDKDVFTIKMSGGPDGDVAGNQILNLFYFYPNTAKLIALTDRTGTIYDEKGLDLAYLKDLFHQEKGICHYPPQKLSAEGFLLDKETKRYPTPYVQETLCWRNMGGQLVENWLSGSEVNHLLRYNVHKAKADIFIPAGGRPRTLNETNIHDFFDEFGNPTARGIVEGANLYLSTGARHVLEKKGVLIIKDSSANKAGVMCSSFEVLCGLVLKENEFLKNKEIIVSQILTRLKESAKEEAHLLLSTHQETHEFLTELSDKLAFKMNLFKYQILDFLEGISLSGNTKDPMIQCLLNYCLPFLREKYSHQIQTELPDQHKKAIIACFLSSHLVYSKGMDWSPSIVDILPIILSSTR